MRGKLITVVTLEHTGRIIPAHAGQTVASCGVSTAVSDHPRACGANWSNVTVEGDPDGSSPRMRGKLAPPVVRAWARRIIPAHAGQTWCSLGYLPMLSDHPRACGANRRSPDTNRTNTGSSPRMRGKPCSFVCSFRFLRIIPAHAGQTGNRIAVRLLITDHPRACGANVSAQLAGWPSIGSSPRMRGKPDKVQIYGEIGRIIPAHAGQTPTSRSRTPPSADHPRACGANLVATRAPDRRLGSSPRMRGKRCKYWVPQAPRRIIPAHAGQTDRPTDRIARRRDHPRACGANLFQDSHRRRGRGSSPRMRGKQTVGGSAYDAKRIIPAHAGQTNLDMLHSVNSTPDHPRACGANRPLAGQSATKIGSSPRMRGKRPDPRCICPRTRIIPAHAGQTPISGLRTTSTSDHPRACGANTAFAPSPGAYDGSSPRMRGKPTVYEQSTAHRRIIPAHAGQTSRQTAHCRATADHPRACGANMSPGSPP